MSEIKEATGETYVMTTPLEFQNVEFLDDAFHRATTEWEPYSYEFWAEGHHFVCVHLDDCVIIIVDGIHKIKMPACRFDELRFRVLDPYGRVPYGCEKRRLPTTDACRRCLRFVGRRTPLPDDGDLAPGERTIPDYGRADGLQMVAAMARRLVEIKRATGGGASSTSQLEADIIAAAEKLAPKQGKAKKQSREVDELLKNAESMPSSSRRTSTNGDQSALERTNTIEKLERDRSFRDVIAHIEGSTSQREKELLAMDDTERFVATYGGYLHPSSYLEMGKEKAWYGLGPNAFTLDSIVGKETTPTGTVYLTKWTGFKTVTKSTANDLQQWMVDKYEKQGGSKGHVKIFELDQAFPDNPNLPNDVFTMSATDLAQTVMESTCLQLKALQVGEPPSGYLHTSAGEIIIVAECRLILDLYAMRNSESGGMVRASRALSRRAAACRALSRRVAPCRATARAACSAQTREVSMSKLTILTLSLSSPPRADSHRNRAPQKELSEMGREPEGHRDRQRLQHPAHDSREARQNRPEQPRVRLLHMAQHHGTPISPSGACVHRSNRTRNDHGNVRAPPCQFDCFPRPSPLLPGSDIRRRMALQEPLPLRPVLPGRVQPGKVPRDHREDQPRGGRADQPLGGEVQAHCQPLEFGEGHLLSVGDEGGAQP
jgi:hypothetical protein